MTRSLRAAALAVFFGAAILAAPLPALTSGAAAQSGDTAKSTTAKPAKKKKALTAGQIAAQQRQKKCGAEWKEAKAAGRVEKSMTWPRYWSACNKRLKAGG